MAAVLPALAGVSLTLPTGKSNLLVQLVAADARFAAVLQNCATLSIQSALANGSNVVLVGDQNVSASNAGMELLSHDQYPAQGQPAMNVPLGCIYFFTTAASLVVNVWVTFS